MEYVAFLFERIKDYWGEHQTTYLQLIVLMTILSLLIYDYYTAKNNQFEKQIKSRLGKTKRGRFDFSFLTDKFSNKMKAIENKVELELARANLEFTVKEYMSFMMIGAVGGAILGFALFPFAALFKGIVFFLGDNILQVFVARLIAGGTFAFAGTFFPKFWVKRLITKRQKLVSTQLQDALSNIADALGSGQTIQQAIKSVGDEMPYPIGNEFKTVYLEVQAGKTFPDAMKNLKQRVNLPDMDLAVNAIEISYESGGELEKLLRGMVHILQERVDTANEIQKSISSSKMVGVIMLVAPWLFLGFFTLVNANTYKILFSNFIGWILIFAAAALYAIAAVLIRMIIKYATKGV